jgi:hypothetical protein
MARMIVGYILLKHNLQVNLCTDRRDIVLEIREISMLTNAPNSTVPLQSYLCTGWSRITGWIKQILQYLVNFRFPESCIQYILQQFFLVVLRLGFLRKIAFFLYHGEKSSHLFAIHDLFLNCRIVLHNK